MARPRVPTAVLDARGAFRANPQRRRPREPEGTGEIGNPPTRLSPAERRAWREVVKQAPAGVLSGSDRLFVEQIARLLAEQWSAGVDFPVTRAKRLDVLLGKLGMNPSDRARLEVSPPADGKNPFAQCGHSRRA